MKTCCQMVIACILTAVVTAFATAYIIQYKQNTYSEYVCKDNASPDINGCCPGEEYTYIDKYQEAFCCPMDGGDCFPPIDK